MLARLILIIAVLSMGACRATRVAQEAVADSSTPPSLEIVGGLTLPAVPLVVNGVSGADSPDGTVWVSLHGGPSPAAASDPVLRVAHFVIVPDRSLSVRAMGSQGGNAPDKFTWTGKYDFEVDRAWYTVDLRVDGRAHTFHVNGEQFELGKGNFFRIKLVRGPSVIARQLPVIDVMEDDAAAVRARFGDTP